MITLEAKKVIFYSPNDEAAFFERLNSLKSVGKVYGVGRSIYFEIEKRKIGEMELRELLATFFRYRVSMRQLQQLENSKNRKWFTDPSFYWHKKVFR